jgi:hypothetical protein
MNRHECILPMASAGQSKRQRSSHYKQPEIHERGWHRLARLGWGLLSVVLVVGCHTPKVSHEAKMGPVYDRPFPLGQVTDAHWETMQTNAEAADFIFYDHEFVGETADLTPLGRKHLLSVALRLEHVPFPVVVEESPRGENPQLDEARRQTVVNQLVQLGLNREMVEARVVVSPAFTEGLSAIEGEAAYYSTLLDGQYGTGFRGMNRGFSGWRR